MKFTDISFNLLIISTILIIVLLYYVLKKKTTTSQLKKSFSYVLICVLIICIGVILQTLFSVPFNINPIFFENFIYIGTCFLPVALFFTTLAFKNTKFKFKSNYILLFFIPILSLIVLFTNNFHHLFYKKYSTNLNEMIFGWYFYIHTFYTYILLFISMISMIKYAIKNSGFFSKQSLLIIIGTSIPTIINVLGTLKIIEMNVYLTPISFSITVFFYAFAIFKFKFLSIAPIALQRIVDRISDSYIVLDEDNIITDFNETFLTTFKFKDNAIRNQNIVDLIKLKNENNIDIDSLILILDKVKASTDTFHYEKHLTSVNKYFNIEINSITNNGNFLGILILFKDITQHIEDMNTIKSKQDLLIEKERLASLGQLIGGIAHNLKTPIMSISGAAEGLTDLVKEYDSSIGDPEVNEQDHHEIAHDMTEWIEKIKTHTSYMSDIITAVKGQAVTLNEEENDNFTIEELVKRVNILMKHELKNALIDLNVNINVDSSLTLNGNVNSLVQVINNLISNAIQSYNGKTNESIDFCINKDDKFIKFSVIDHGCGMTKEVKDKLFKEMITTKGKNGSGLGLFMSYSTIRGHFNGNMTFESEVGKGTTFNITLPL